MKKNKAIIILLIINFFVIFSVMFFPMKSTTSKFVAGDKRSGYILEKNVIVKQPLKFMLSNVYRISLMMSTTNLNEMCNIEISLLKDNKLIEKKKMTNQELDFTQSKSDSTTKYVNFFLKKRLTNTLNQKYEISVATDCDNIIKLQYYNLDTDDDAASYNDMDINKKLGIRYSGEKNSIDNFLYPFFIIMVSIIILVNRKSDDDEKI